jgi:alpha-ribazole phosphatase/probable phosphoglycerate mutase
MNCRLFLIRHGQTIWNHERRCQGFSDIPLNDEGEDQAAVLSRVLSSYPLDAVYCSDLVRSRRTAEIIASPHNISVRVDVRLRELNQGELEGSSLENLLSDHQELLKLWMESPKEVVMPGGESMTTLQQRAWQAIRDIVKNHHDKTVAVVAHNLCNLSIICKAIELDLNHFRRLKMENGSITEILFTPNHPVLVRINETRHLD